MNEGGARHKVYYLNNTQQTQETNLHALRATQTIALVCTATAIGTSNSLNNLDRQYPVSPNYVCRGKALIVNRYECVSVFWPWLYSTEIQSFLPLFYCHL
jgi:hypothetical protein